ncbi:MAG: sigma-70 family RNA polymerase sigma factor [Planctomycetes bacterium]|nr:sigma-70 family RNA polymerase sigma factor [Planctomycetota bacterium]
MDAFEQLRVSCTKRAWRLAWASTLNATDADDVMQQAFIVAWRRREAIPADAWPWFATVVVNCARNHRKKMNRMRLRESKLRPTTEDSARLSTAEQSELREQLLRALSDLPEGEREAVTLCHMAGLTQTQASSELGVALNTVKSQVKRGLDRLRQRLGPQAEGLEAYLATVAFPQPAAGWEAASLRWRNGVESTVTKAPPVTRITFTGVAAVAATWLALVIAWLLLSTGNAASPLSINPTTASAMPASSPVTNSSADPLNDGSLRPDTARENLDVTREDTPADVSTAVSTAPSLTPPTNEPIGRTEILPLGRNSNGLMQVRTDYYEEGPIYTQWTELVTASDTILQGSYRKFRLDSTIWETSEFENGLREGTWKRYYENGALACRGEFHAGQVIGLWTWFYDNAQKMAEGSYTGGEKHDVWRAWHPNGERRFVETYRNGKRDGKATYYDEHGRKIRETTWLEGVKHGPETEFDSEGNALSPTIYDHGERR